MVKRNRGGSRRPKRREGQVDIAALRRWRKEGGIVALFPEMPATEGLVTSYAHAGQHGAADYTHVMGKTMPVPLEGPDQERDDLLDELRSIGYNPLVRRRRKGARRQAGGGA